MIRIEAKNKNYNGVIANITFENGIATVENLSDDLKKKIRVFIDALYDHYIGVQIKAKKFIDGLDGWADIMK